MKIGPLSKSYQIDNEYNRGFNPMCALHPRNQCETYCLDCRRRICV